MRNLAEMDKLEAFLKEAAIPYERIDQEDVPLEGHPYTLVQFERHQICVPSAKDAKWDAICHYGSYGAEEGLLEIYGSIVSPTAGDSVEGWLTAEDVIKRVCGARMENE